MWNKYIYVQVMKGFEWYSLKKDVDMTINKWSRLLINYQTLAKLSLSFINFKDLE